MRAMTLTAAVSCLVTLGLAGLAHGQVISEDAFEDAQIQFAKIDGPRETVVLATVGGGADKWMIFDSDGNFERDCDGRADCMQVADCVLSGGENCTGGGGNDPEGEPEGEPGEKGWLGRLFDNIFKKKDDDDGEEEQSG